jgi:hypothetical protein
MRHAGIRLAGAAAIAALLAGCAGTAAPVGTVAGDVVGGAAWAGVKGAKLAFTGGKFVAKTTGRTVIGAARGVHEEFSKPSEAPPPKTADAKNGQVSQASQAQGATLAD